MDSQSVFIVDDHPLLCEGLRRTILARSEFTVIGECGDGNEALERICAQPPDVAIVDLTLNGLDGPELISALRESLPRLMILVYTGCDDCRLAGRLLRQGVRGYVLKEEPGRTVVEAIKRVIAGDVYVSERLREKLISALLEDSSFGEDPAMLLSRRETEVLRLLGDGLGCSEIALQLGLSTNTIASYRERIKQKMGLGNSRDLLRFAARWIDS